MENKQNNEEKNDLEKPLFVYNWMKEYYESEDKRLNDIDTKSSNLMAFIGVILSFQGIFGSFLVSNIKNHSLIILLVIIFALSLIFLTFSFCCFIHSYNFKYFTAPIKSTKMIEYAKSNKSYESIIKTVTANLNGAINKNNIVMENKIKFSKKGILFLIKGMISTVIFVIFYLIITLWR